MLHIFQPDSLGTLISIEGEEWGKRQEADKVSPYGYYAHLKAYNQRIKYIIDYPEEEGEFPLSEFADVRGIKDADGVCRYLVEPGGEIVFLASSNDLQFAKRAKAQAAGIRIEGDLVTSGADA